MNDIFSDYCLVCDELLTVNSEKQVLLQNFTRDLYQHVGFPNRFSEMGLYLGNYRKTPFGVHVDRCGVFSFPVAGVKKFRLWTSDFVKKNPKLDRAFNYASFKKDSHLITIKPGDMSYWPSSSWHIAESDGSFSATWSLGVWVDKDHQSMFVDTLQDMLKIKLLPQGRLSMTLFEGLSANTGEIRKLPKSFKKSISVLQKLSFVELQEHFIKSWMGHVSKQGMKTQPSVDLKLTLKAQISLRYKHSKILWHASRVQKEKIFLSFGGVFVESSKSSGLFKLVKALNSGESCQLSHYIHDVLKNKDLRSLQKFAVVGAFKIIR